MQYDNVALGGTFDKFHKGHMSFINFAFSVSKSVIIGLTSDSYVAEYKKDSVIAPFLKRKKKLMDYLEKKHFYTRAKIVPIDDLFGPTLSKNNDLDALVVTDDSVNGGDKINQKRMELGLSKLPLLITPLEKEDGVVISSANIRKGITDDDGKPFVNPLWISKNLKMPEGLRILLHKPFGKLLESERILKNIDPTKAATVGDITTLRFLKNGIKPILSVIDFVVERKRQFSGVKELGFMGTEEIIHLVNPQSTITKDIWFSLSKIVNHLHEKKPQIILIEGEEDLLVLPLILSLPLGFMIFYGQPNAGYVQVEVTIQEKENARNIIALFAGEYL